MYINCNIRELLFEKKNSARHVFFGTCAKNVLGTVLVEALTILLARKKNLIKMQPISNWHWHKNACV